MPIKPDGAFITFSNTSPAKTGTLFVADVRYEDLFQMFQRIEFTGEKQRQAKNADGSMAAIYYLNGGRPVQFFSDCNSYERSRPLDPDDNRIDSIYRRFDITRFVLFGEPSDKTSIDNLRAVAQEHQTRRARFQARQEIARGDVSIDYITNVLQPESLSYVTSTGLTVSGRCWGDTGVIVSQANILIERFAPIVDYEVPNADGSTSTVLCGYELVFERWVEQAARSATW